MFQPRREKKSKEDVPGYETDFSLEDNSELEDEETIIEVGTDQHEYETEELKKQGYGDNGLDVDVSEDSSES